MTLVYADRVKESSTTTGTGTLTLAGAVTGYRTFTSALSTGAIVTYCITDGTDWEVGEGVFTTSGTTLSRPTIIASSNAGSAVNWGAGTRSVFLVQSARDVGVNAVSVADAYQGVAGSLAATLPRAFIASVVVNALTTQRLYMVGLPLPRGFLVSTITFYAGTNAAITPTNQWAAFFSPTLVKRAISADDTSTAWASNAAKPFAMTTPYVTTTAGFHYLGLMVKAGTVPQLCGTTNGITTTGTPRALAPLPCGLASDTGLTDPASCPSTAGAITLSASLAYAEVS